uniref:Uncharacterized protein n=2 Tax=Oryza sativa subsp. japonica TaxID=39947 RepID=Q10PC6_ORYSJ|nr:hypothetical protein LOC_Os03g13579 [Oryza sativa Japonica Group]
MSVGKASKTSGSNCVQADITQMKRLNLNPSDEIPSDVPCSRRGGEASPSVDMGAPAGATFLTQTCAVDMVYTHARSGENRGDGDATATARRLVAEQVAVSARWLSRRSRPTMRSERKKRRPRRCRRGGHRTRRCEGYILDSCYFEGSQYGLIPLVFSWQICWAWPINMVKARSEESCQAGAEIKRCPEEDTGHGCQLPTDGLDQRLVREKIFWAQAATAGSRPHGVDVEQERQVHRARRAAAPRCPNPMSDHHSVFLFIRSCMPQKRRLRLFLLSDPDNVKRVYRTSSTSGLYRSRRRSSPRASAPITRVVTSLAH